MQGASDEFKESEVTIMKNASSLGYCYYISDGRFAWDLHICWEPFASFTSIDEAAVDKGDQYH